MTTKFSANKRKSKTPAVCKKTGPPLPDLVPPGPFPGISNKPLTLITKWQRPDSTHPWLYAESQILMPINPGAWRIIGSPDPDFTFDALLFYNETLGVFSLRGNINHQGHAPHTAESGLQFLKQGIVFFLPRFHMTTDNPSVYYCSMTITQ